MFKVWINGARETVGNFLGHNCYMHAAGLTYFALLAVVPVLCCVLVAAKVCRVDHYAKAELNRQIDAMIERIEDGQNDPLLSRVPGFSSAEQQQKRLAAQVFARDARKFSDRLFAQVEHFDVGTLGWIGFGFLLWTVISSLASVETSFNEIFSVEKPRPLWTRAYLYLFIMVIMPVLATVALSLPILNIVRNLVNSTLGATWFTKWAGDGLLWILESWCFRVALTSGFATLFFAFFFWIVPNCKVRIRPALIGGFATAIAFGGWVKLCALAQVGIARSSALYGSFAFLPIVLAWLYMSWQIVLLGACLVKTLDK